MSDGRPTLGDVAREAGVHKATASRALNEATVHRVSPGTVQRVRSVAERLGYQPNLHARGLRTHRSFTVGVLLPDIVDPIYAPIVRGIENVLAARDYTALLINTDLDPARERSAIDHLRARQVDGFIVGASAAGLDLVAELQRAGTPIVTIVPTDDGRYRWIVQAEHPAALDQVVDHLVGLGHRRIGFLTGPMQPPDPRERASAFVAAVKRCGLDPDACPVHRSADLTAPSARRSTIELLTDRPEMTAIVAHNDTMAIGVLRAATLLGLRCPAQLSIVGFNDLPIVAELSPPLTTVHFPSDAIGIAAAELLIEALTGAADSARRHMTFPLVVRHSTAPPRVD